MNAAEFGFYILAVVILTGAVLHSIAVIVWTTRALAEWIDAVFFHRTAGMQKRE